MKSTEVVQNWSVGMTERRRRCFELISARAFRLPDAADKWGNTDERLLGGGESRAALCSLKVRTTHSSILGSSERFSFAVNGRMTL